MKHAVFSPAAVFARRSVWVCTRCRVSCFSTSAIRAAKKKGKNGSRSVPETPARTRFAPSPTGYLHLGSLRTALFNYLLARRTGGQFLLRIEDTDQKRTVPGAEQRLYDDLRWAGLHWDEGPVKGGPYGPYRQSERTSLYASEAEKLITSGHAYRCFCTPERLDTLARHRNEQGLTPGYDGHCTSISKEESDDRASRGEKHVVRLRVAEPYPMFDDIVYGKTGQSRPGVDYKDAFPDPILLKSDGRPTYHLANVVDDHHMKITHVIRGTEWMASTPLHVALYKAFNWEQPQFGHVPLLVDASGQKLSKRNADIDISYFRDQKGVFPETLVNFAALLGWSHTQRSDVFSLQELEKMFDLKLTKGNAVVAFDKMWYLQKAHARRYTASGGPQFEEMVRRVEKAVEKAFDLQQIEPILQSRSLYYYIASILRKGGRSYTTAEAFISENKALFTQSLDRPAYSPVSETAPAQTIPLSELHDAAKDISSVTYAEWTADTHLANINAYQYSPPADPGTALDSKAKEAEQQHFRKELFHYLRWALLAGAPGIGIPAAMEILGLDETVRRLEEAKRLTESRRDRMVDKAEDWSLSALLAAMIVLPHPPFS